MSIDPQDDLTELEDTKKLGERSPDLTCRTCVECQEFIALIFFYDGFLGSTEKNNLVQKKVIFYCSGLFIYF